MGSVSCSAFLACRCSSHGPTPHACSAGRGFLNLRQHVQRSRNASVQLPLCAQPWQRVTFARVETVCDRLVRLHPPCSKELQPLLACSVVVVILAGCVAGPLQRALQRGPGLSPGALGEHVSSFRSGEQSQALVPCKSFEAGGFPNTVQGIAPLPGIAAYSGCGVQSFCGCPWSMSKERVSRPLCLVCETMQAVIRALELRHSASDVKRQLSPSTCPAP